MKFHELHVGQHFLTNGFNKEFVKLSHSTASYNSDAVVHFSATDEVDGLNTHDLQTLMKDVVKPAYPLPQNDYIGGMGIVGRAIAYLESTPRANFHETMYLRRLYFDANVSALHYLRASFDALNREHDTAVKQKPYNFRIDDIMDGSVNDAIQRQNQTQSA